MEATGFLKAIGGLFGDNTFTDAVITCGGRQWKVHRNILSCHSKFFKRCWREGFLESETHELKLDDDDPDAIERFLNYAYTLDYDDTPAERSGLNNALEMNAMVYGLADKYECVDLGPVAIRKFTLAAVAASKSATVPCEAIRIVYDSTPSSNRKLRDVCMKLWAVMKDQVLDGANKQAVRQLLLVDAPEFGLDVSFLAPISWEALAVAFAKATEKDCRVMCDVIRRENLRGTTYGEICDSRGEVVQSVAAAIRWMLHCLCRRVQRWAGDSQDLVDHLLRALAPFPPHALESRAELQIQFHWQHGRRDVQAAVKKSSASLFTNREFCDAIASAAQHWVDHAIETRMGTLWAAAVDHGDSKQLREAVGGSPVEARVAHAPTVEESKRREQQNQKGRAQWLQETHDAVLNEATQTECAVGNSYETFRAEQTALGKLDPQTGPMALPVREFFEDYSVRLATSAASAAQAHA